MKAKVLVPEQRFPGFEGEWTTRKLRDNIELISGQHLSPSEYNKNKTGVPYFTGPSDYTNNASHITKWTDLSKQIAFNKDVLITVKGSGVGTLLFLQLPKVAMGRQLMAIRTVESSSYLIFAILGTKQNLFIQLASGNMIPGLSRADILSLKINLPSLPEQQRIASFLSAVDKKIELLSRKKELLGEYKKGVMQKLFKQEIRFKDDDGKEFAEWEEKRLGDVCSVNPKCDNLPDSFTYIDLESVESGRLIKQEMQYKETAPSRAQRLLKLGDILFQTVRPYQQNNLYFMLNGVFVASTGYAQLRTQQNSLFLYYQLHSCKFLNDVLKNCTGSNYPAINSSDLRRINVYKPCLKEQKKIASFLTSLDDKIRIVEKELDAIKVFKKGLLQKMFV